MKVAFYPQSSNIQVNSLGIWSYIRVSSCRVLGNKTEELVGGDLTEAFHPLRLTDTLRIQTSNFSRKDRVLIIQLIPRILSKVASERAGHGAIMSYK